MNEYIQEKVKKIVNNFETHFTEQYSENDWKRLKGVRVQEPLAWLYDNIEKAITEAYNRGVGDSLRQIPADRLTRELQTVGWNDCRQQTIDNITKLLTNK